MAHTRPAQNDLFPEPPPAPPAMEQLGDGAWLLHRFAAPEQERLREAIEQVSAASPFRHMVTPGGFSMSVAMTNCGQVGWVSDRTGYRYDRIDPSTGKNWPPMPEIFQSVAARAALAGGFPSFEPDACLINRYEPGARMGLHQDKDEKDFAAPIVSVSLGLSAIFLFGGNTRKERPKRMRLESGDVVVWGGPARRAYHGIAPLADGESPLTGRYRLNLTFRKAI